MICSAVPHTTKSIELASRCSIVGSTTYCPLILPTRTAATGPSKGISEIAKAMLAALTATISGSCSPSIESTVATTCTSLRIPSGNIGRKVRSITRPVKIASSVARPSRLTQRLPLIFPAA